MRSPAASNLDLEFACLHSIRKVAFCFSRNGASREPPTAPRSSSPLAADLSAITRRTPSFSACVHAKCILQRPRIGGLMTVATASRASKSKPQSETAARMEAGKKLREKVSRASQAAWKVSPRRADPVAAAACSPAPTPARPSPGPSPATLAAKIRSTRRWEISLSPTPTRPSAITPGSSPPP